MEEFGATQNERLDRIRDSIRSGHNTWAESDLRAFTTSGAWQLLSLEVRARAYRMLASLVLRRRDDVAEAHALLDRATAEHPTGRYVLTEAVIRQHVSGAGAGLAVFSELSDRDEWHLRLALLIPSHIELSDLQRESRQPFGVVFAFQGFLPAAFAAAFVFS